VVREGHVSIVHKCSPRKTVCCPLKTDVSVVDILAWTATLSIRTVPNQDVDELERALISKLHTLMKDRGTRNSLAVTVRSLRVLVTSIVWFVSAKPG
jgi:hypothetical protein